MKRNYYFCFAAFLSCALISGCAKDDPDTALRILVRDSTTVPVSGATVRLYLNSNDLFNNVNPLASQTSGADGSVIFNNLDAGQLYAYRADHGCRNNLHLWTSPQYTMNANEPLIPGDTRTVTTLIAPTGAILKVVNNSAVTYIVENYFDSIGPVPSHSTQISYHQPGHYFVSAYPAGSTGISRDTVVLMVCGDTTRLVYP